MWVAIFGIKHPLIYYNYIHNYVFTACLVYACNNFHILNYQNIFVHSVQRGIQIIEIVWISEKILIIIENSLRIIIIEN